MKKSYLFSATKAAVLLLPSKAIHLLLMVLFFSLFGNTLIAQTQTFTTPGTTTWTCPAGVTSINVEAWGGGGAGASVGNGSNGGFGGGGGGAYASSLMSVIPGTNYTIVVGKGGTASSKNNDPNDDGGNSTFNSTSVKAAGGSGAFSTQRTGGAGGTAANSSGTIRWSGGNGADGSTSVFNSGGGGGGAGSIEAGGNASGTTAGTGTSSFGGAGGAGRTNENIGIGGNLIGGGGGGAVLFQGSFIMGGSGANGQVIISWCSANTTWNVINGVGSWTDGSPTSSKNLTFSGNFNSSTDTSDTVVEGCSCKVNSGATVVFTSGKTLKISNEVKILGPTGSLTFENNASLVQINEPVTNNPNSGSIIYKRKTISVLSSDYTYWSSPVENQQLTNVSASYASGMFYSYNDFAIPENWKQEIVTATMLTGKGYIIRAAQNSSASAIYDATFMGAPNNGTKTISIGATGTSNLLGNPYPSAINADLFLATNSTLVEGTIYLWTHKTAIQSAGNITNGTAGSGAYAYTSDDYATYNGTGGAAASGGIIPLGKIAAGQAFFTTSKSTGKSVTFNNAMRLSSVGAILDNSQFFKSRNPKIIPKNVIEKNRLWLNLTNTQGAFKQTLVGYVTDATNDYDSSFDGESFDGNEFVDFYSVSQDKNLTIQGRALPFDETDEVPLGFKSTIDSAFTINIDQVDGSLTNQTVFIEDKLTNTIFDLKNGDYTFTTVAGTFNGRFVLRYTNKNLGNNNFSTKENLVLVSNTNKQIRINAFAETIDKVSVYDIAGKQIFQKTNVNSNELSISNLGSGHQVLVVKTSLQNGTTVSNKIIY
ncbi:T9SS sorting signal type C domain-containing protein [Flavobacterium sp.]|uniref:glycine-rich domain-containing protein n=1 Tax=Flavobacterium sp. TaxID=239 RepID=UPI0037504E48